MPGFRDIESLDAKSVGELIGEGPGAVGKGGIQGNSGFGVFGLYLDRAGSWMHVKDRESADFCAVVQSHLRGQREA